MYTVIHSTMYSEMNSLHLTHPKFWKKWVAAHNVDQICYEGINNYYHFMSSNYTLRPVMLFHCVSIDQLCLTTTVATLAC